MSQEFEANIKIENGTNTNGAEKTDKQCLPLLFNLPNLPVHCIYNRDAAEQKYQKTERNQAGYRNDAVMDEAVPWTDCAKPHKNREVQKHIDSGLQRVIESFQTKPIA